MKGVKLKEISGGGGGGRRAETRTLRVSRITGPGNERKKALCFALSAHLYRPFLSC